MSRSYADSTPFYTRDLRVGDFGTLVVVGECMCWNQSLRILREDCNLFLPGRL